MRSVDSVQKPPNATPIEQVQIESGQGSAEAEEQGKIKLAIKSDLEALKRINKGWYDKVISKSKEGKAAANSGVSISCDIYSHSYRYQQERGIFHQLTGIPNVGGVKVYMEANKASYSQHHS